MPLFPESYDGPLVDDAGTLRRFREGDAEVLAEMYRAHRPKVECALRFGCRYESSAGGGRLRGIDDEALRADLLHDVFLRAFEPEARRRYDGLRPFSAWLATILRYRVLKHFDAAAQRRPHDPFDELVERFEPVDPPQSAAFESAELQSIVKRFAASLGDRERRIFELLPACRPFGVLTQEEAARQVGISKPTFRKLRDRTLRLFSQELRRSGYLDGTGEGWSPRGVGPALLQLAISLLGTT